MNTKSFLLSSLAGAVVYFLLGWLFYGVIFTDIYPEGGQNKMMFIALACLFYAFVYALIFMKWAQISTFKTGMIAGLIIGLLYAISMNLFMYSSQEMQVNKFITSVLSDGVSTAIMAGVIALVHGKTKS